MKSDWIVAYGNTGHCRREEVWERQLEVLKTNIELSWNTRGTHRTRDGRQITKQSTATTGKDSRRLQGWKGCKVIQQQLTPKAEDVKTKESLGLCSVLLFGNTHDFHEDGLVIL